MRLPRRPLVALACLVPLTVLVPAAEASAVSQPRARYLVGLTKNVAAADVEGLRAVQSYDQVDTVLANLTAGQAADLAAEPGVAYVEKDVKVHATATETDPPNWGLDRIDQANLPLSSSYTYQSTGAGVVAYVLDTGIRSTHSEFNGRIGAGYDAVDGRTTEDCDGHGTHVAGILGGTKYGVAKSVTLVPVRVLDCDGSGYLSDVVEGVNWVVAHRSKSVPAIINLSLGGSTSSAMTSAVNNAISAGVTVVAAAGNDGVNACSSAPANIPAVITVGASARTDAVPTYSNYGSCVDVFAPGDDITSAWDTSNNATETESGTSMASPHVAGAAALLLQLHPAWTPAEVSDALVNASVANVLSGSRATPNKLLQVTTEAPTPDTTAPQLTALNSKKVSPYRITITPTGTDVGSGVKAFFFVWNQSQTSTAGTLQGTDGVTKASPVLKAGTWYLHIRVQDRAGNYSAWRVTGGYKMTAVFVAGTAQLNSRCSTPVVGKYVMTTAGGVARCLKEGSLNHWRKA